jgi:penicillin-binding protein 1B
MSKSARKRNQNRVTRRLLLAVPFTVLVAGIYGLVLGWQVTREFDIRGWDLPARVYAAPLELFPGKTMTPQSLRAELERLSYRVDSRLAEPGSYFTNGRTLTLRTRAHATPMGMRESERFSIEFNGSAIVKLNDGSGDAANFAELDPVLIGSIFPANGEDRIVLAPGEVPELVIAGLKTVEDRRFDEHFGIDLRGIARAALVNIRSGELQQGASTLTQQLIRSYFLNSERTWWRKLREAFMAVALEMRKDKAEIAVAYVNEVYLGQDGARAIHGFGLASQFYFAKPLAELDVHEVALLIAIVRGPSYYDPRRNPERARARRDLVLEQMAAAGLIETGRAKAAAAQELGIVRNGGETGYYASFLDLVRRQLKSDYAAEDLESKGLLVFSTLDPRAQALAASAIATELDSLQEGRPPLEAAVIVTTPQNSEVKALVGGRNPGFNRALDAKRQIGSLVKPAVYLAAIESGTTTFATLVEDAAITVQLEDGTAWAPTNYEGEGNGTVTAARALAESLNLATVHVGLDTGVDAVARVISRLADVPPPPAYPSLLLGAAEFTPLDVAKLYNTLANGGFREPLRAVRSVVDAAGQTLQHYRIEIEQAAEPAAVYALNKALVQVMVRGTGRTAQQRLPQGLTTAGKTGTSDDLRDSWFAGFSADHLVVTWIGNDANEPVQLTGATGAARIWSRVLGTLDTRPYNARAPSGVVDISVDYVTGLATDADCRDAVPLAMPRKEVPAEAARCGSTRTRLGSRIRRIFRGDGK